MKKHLPTVFLWIWLLAPVLSQAQIDTSDIISEVIEDVFVTANLINTPTRSVSSPVTTVQKKEIQKIGSQRLSNVLQEQTGIVMTRDHGLGVQLQGLDSDYTLILIDGVPLIGRTAGTFDLSRITTARISKIEVLKGPNSSLYGSEALAGVINIITEMPKSSTAEASIRYGTYGSIDATLQGGIKKDKLALSVMINRNSTEGFDRDMSTISQTISPYHSYTVQLRALYSFSERLRLETNLRLYRESQDILFGTERDGADDRVSGDAVLQDYNIAPSLSYWLSDDWQMQLYYYYTRYRTDSDMTYESDGSSFSSSYFTQQFSRPELRSTYFMDGESSLIIGAGHTTESVDATRYTDVHSYHAPYVYGQYVMQLTDDWRVTVGARYDAHSVYGRQLSPKLSTLYKVNDMWKVRASLGRGFKAPDFRQLYLAFTNPVAGYSVFGTEEVQPQIKLLQDAGQIAQVLIQPDEIQNVRSESCWAVNIGAKAQLHKYISVDINLFRNDLTDLIDTRAIALKTNGQNVFSYINIEDVYTQGVELGASIGLSMSLRIRAGYQYLDARDKAVLSQIGNGELFRRDPETLSTVRLTRSDYGGLMNRSKHTGNLRLFYQNDNGWNSTLRLIYRSRYGLYDTNGNLILDVDEEYVDGRFLANVSGGKRINDQLDIQAGVDNLLNITEERLPTIPGLQWWVRVNYQFK